MFTLQPNEEIPLPDKIKKIIDEVTFQEKQIYYRIIALWVICEAMLGGIIHGFKLPISGLIIGSTAVICICLMGLLVPQRGAILKATTVVVMFKLILSPQSPFPAYVAVLFQGVCGELIFSGKKKFALRCYLIAFLALIESAFQRVLIMTILFGKNIWEAINEFISKLVNSDPSTNYSFYFVAFYLILHLVAAILVGYFTSNLPEFILKAREEKSLYQLVEKIENENKIKPKKKKISLLFLLWLIIALIYLHSLLFPENAILPKNETIVFIFRSTVLLLSWYFFLAPLLLKLMKFTLEKQKTKLKVEMEETMLLLPSTKKIIVSSWQKSKIFNGWKRITFFWRCVIVNALF